MAAYRLVQESLNNISQYAAAQQVLLSMRAEDGRAVLVVADDGQGFDPGCTPRGAHGLQGMRYRCEAMGGQLHIRAAPGQGSCIEARLPLSDTVPVPPRARVSHLSEEVRRPDRDLRPRYRPCAAPRAATVQAVDASPDGDPPKAQHLGPALAAERRRA